MPSNALTLRVLIVDDNHDAADTLAELLRLHGADVRVCYDGLTALEIATNFSFAAAILDIHMPVIDGCELARRLTTLVGSRRVLLIAMTGVSDAAARKRTAEAGFDLHLTKSAAPQVLIAALEAFHGWLADHPRHVGTETATED